MGKKSRNKHHRPAPTKQASVPKITFSSTVAPTVAVPVATTTPVASGKIAPGTLLQGEVRRDIVRIALLLAGIALALIILTIIDNRTTLLLDAGKKLATALRLQ